MRTRAAAAAVGFAAGLAACAAVQWKAKPEVAEPGDWASTDVRRSTAAARPRPSLPPIPEPPYSELEQYADLGPNEIDVSGYPTQLKYDYGLFKSSCGGCHPLARAINSPAQSRTYWRFHLARMRFHTRLSGGSALSPAETGAVLDFLEYDSRIRKAEHGREFEALTDALKRRYDAVLEKRLKKLQSEPQPQILRGD